MKLGIDILGNIAILKFDRKVKNSKKKKIALNFLKENKSVRTILEKTAGFSGRLRTQKTRWLAGDKTKEALYKENACSFRFNVDTCYFSPRLSSERLEIARKVKKGEKVLVMFSGVGPFAIVIGKLSKAGKIISVELSRECCKYAKLNVKRNKLDNVEIVQGDVRRVIGKGKKVSDCFDRIVMPRPNLEDSFLDVAFSVSKKNTIIHYYGFYLESEKENMKALILDEAKKAGKKVKLPGVKKAGDIAARKYRFRADFEVF